MKEPDLEEEALTAKAGKHDVTVERRTVKDQVGEATITSPSGKETKVQLDQKAPGRFAKSITANEPGLYRISMDGLTALTVAGDMNAPEFQRVVATDEPLRPVLAKTGGGSFFLGGTAGAAPVEAPSVSMVRSGRRFYGSSWLGLKSRDVYEVKAISYTPLVGGFAALGIALGLLSLTWYREGR
jgi:hypothetical protein